MFSVKEFRLMNLLLSLDKVLDYGDTINIPKADERYRTITRKETSLFDANSYKLNVDAYDVSLLGIKIFKLTLYGNVYEGQSIGINMEIISMIFIIIAVLVEILIIRFKSHNKNEKTKSKKAR